MKTISLLSMVLFLFSCKKTKLEGEYSILIGEWKWVQTIVYPENDTVMANKNVMIKFKKGGKITFIEEGEREKCYRVVITRWELPYVTIFLDNKSENEFRFQFLSTNDSLKTPHFPIINANFGIVNSNYFIRNQ